MKLPAERFVDEMLGQLWRQFYFGQSKQFFQDRRFLIQAITWPAREMNKMGAKLPASKYRQILGTVISAIRKHGVDRVKVRRFSIYFLHAVQEHMKHHGDEYYEVSKDVRRIGHILPPLCRSLGLNGPRKGPPDRTTEVLAQMNRVLRSPGGRRRRIQSRQPELPTFPPLKAGK